MVHNESWEAVQVQGGGIHQARYKRDRNSSLRISANQLCEEPSCLKSATIIPVTKKRLVWSHLKDIADYLLDLFPFAYRANKTVDDAVNIGLHYILPHFTYPAVSGSPPS